MQTTYIFVFVHLVSNLREVCLFPNLNTADSQFVLPVINTVSINTSTRLYRGRFKTVQDDDTYKYKIHKKISSRKPNVVLLFKRQSEPKSTSTAKFVFLLYKFMVFI